jgi:hypothetical protein
LAQTLLYMTDVGASMASLVEGVVVAPDGIAGDVTSENTPAGRLGIASTSAAAARAVEFMVGCARPIALGETPISATAT